MILKVLPHNNTVGMQLKLIPPGEFQIGSPASESHRQPNEPQRLVKITKPFYLGVYEVTQQQYQRVMENNPSDRKGAKKPVENISWEEAVEFCRKLSAREREEYRLPTEAEWEYGCRGGTTTAYSFGDDASQLGNYAWYKGNSRSTTHDVGKQPPNRWGLYDMHGNVWEWCQDWYADYGNGEVSDPTGPTQGTGHPIRGASFGHPARFLRSACRGCGDPDHRSRHVGFRVARTYNASP
jgi:formylglycine-generating enzyme required for sulfatase activity